MQLTRRRFLLGTAAVGVTAAIGTIPLLPKKRTYTVAEFHRYLMDVWDDDKYIIVTVKPNMATTKITPFSEGIHPPYRPLHRRSAIAGDFDISYSNKVIRYAVN